MVELHVGKLLPDDAHNAQAIMLLFDDESTSTIKRIQEYWYSKINLYFAHVPLFLVRSKCDLRTSFNPTNGVLLKNSMHAMRYLECSAKQMNGVKYVFFEILSALKPGNPSKEPDDSNLIMSPTQAMAAVASKLGSSGPLLRQIMVNARECVMNPAAFPDVKQSEGKGTRVQAGKGDIARHQATKPSSESSQGQILDLSSLLPFNIFGTEPTPEVNNNNTVEKVAEETHGLEKKGRKSEEESKRNMDEETEKDKKQD
ncbi:hypothetical protein Y032_0100g3281 [Ancylostoma ceylanicum]|uniref:Ras family protein n=1 Tax=Ancylostoma ceylanicum TaxID=53326 RepID=A0A016TIK1_9BILA|nr:hypothetical protein Y032_0100g3281 [Ancylostoma ceylanicum]